MSTIIYETKAVIICNILLFHVHAMLSLILLSKVTGHKIFFETIFMQNKNPWGEVLHTLD